MLNRRLLILVFLLASLFSLNPRAGESRSQFPGSTGSFYPANIAYDRPELYLVPGKQSTLDKKYLTEIKARLPVSGDGINEIGKIYGWITANFRSSAGGGALIGKATANSIYESKRVTGCHDSGLILSSILRYYHFPAVMVDAAGIQWAKSGNRLSSGHVFVEAYVQGRWILLDSNSGEYIEDYDCLNPVIPIKKPIEDEGYYVLYKGIDPADYGIGSNKELADQMTEFAAALPGIDLVFPDYEVKSFWPRSQPEIRLSLSKIVGVLLILIFLYLAGKRLRRSWRGSGHE